VRQSNAAWRDPQLEAVRRAFQSMLPGFGDLHVERTPQSLTMTKSGERLSVQQLSDEEKCVLSLAADLARRLVIAHPKAPDPLRESAIVLVDEVELHLHPGCPATLTAWLGSHPHTTVSWDDFGRSHRSVKPERRARHHRHARPRHRATVLAPQGRHRHNR